MSSVDVSRRKRIGRDVEKRILLSRQSEIDMTIVDFCRHESIPDSCIHLWKRKLTAKPVFVEVASTPEARAHVSVPVHSREGKA